MFKKCLVLTAMLLAGCDNNLNIEKATDIINIKNSENCTYVSLSEDDVHYNTSTRTYSVNDKTIRVSSFLESFSIPSKEANQKHLNQLAALEEEGLVKKVSDYVVPDSNGRYLSEIEGAPTKLTDTSMASGIQFKLTKLGKSYFTMSTDSSVPRVCIGHEKVENLILNDLNNEDGTISASYTVKMTDTPNWINSPTIQKEFPILKDRVSEIEAEQKSVVFIKENNKYTIKE